MSLMDIAEYLQMTTNRSLEEEWEVAQGEEAIEIRERESQEPIFASTSEDLQKALDAAEIATLGRNTIVKLLIAAETAKALLTVKGIKEIAGVEIEKEVDLWNLLKREIAELEEIFSENNMEGLL
ncbi:MAG: hypothetical protein EOM02_06200 [Synergistales bacterium]|nr:hypothetical protein [Synergistales bacterium]